MFHVIACQKLDAVAGIDVDGMVLKDNTSNTIIISITPSNSTSNRTAVQYNA